MQHEFITMPKDKIPDYNDKNYVVDLSDIRKRKELVVIDDSIVLNNKLFLKGFDTFKVSLNNPAEGLDYFGITIVPNTSILAFEANITKAKYETFDIKIQQQCQNLIDLCENALRENSYIIHFGI